MNVKDNKGSITIFVVVGLLFMTAFLMISYANILNKSKISKEQFNIISNIYSYNDSDANAYERAYTALRKKKAQTLTAVVENSKEIELTKTLAESLSDYKIYGNTIEDNITSSELPEEYQQVEYIESTGAQYIDTNLYGNINLTADIDIEIEDKNNSPIIGTDNMEWSKEYVCQAWHNALYCFKSSSSINLGDNIRLKIHLDPNAQSTIENIGSVNSKMTEIANTKIYIAKWGSDLGSFKLYSCKFYENEVLVRDFVPCYRKSDSVVGVYDKVNDVFYTNQGTGDFKAGDVVQKRVGDLVTDTEDSNFGKYKITIKATNENEVSEIYDIYLDKNLGTGEYIDFKNGKVVRNDSEEKIELLKIFSFDDYTKIEVLTENAPSKIEVEYLGFTFEENSEE